MRKWHRMKYRYTLKRRCKKFQKYWEMLRRFEKDLIIMRNVDCCFRWTTAQPWKLLKGNQSIRGRRRWLLKKRRCRMISLRLLDKDCLRESRLIFSNCKLNRFRRRFWRLKNRMNKVWWIASFWEIQAKEIRNLWRSYHLDSKYSKTSDFFINKSDRSLW